LEEYQEAARYYASRQPDLDLRFINNVEFAIRRIVQRPLVHRVLEGDIRRCLTKVFPYAVLFTLEKDYVLIIAVMHCHREPGYWRNRVNQL
jgi:toxin ParE1/3/4